MIVAQFWVLARRDRRHERRSHKVALFAAGLTVLGVLAGCTPHRPGFLGRLQQDCEAGDRDACVLLAGPMVAADPRRPTPGPLQPRTAVQRDVEAIMQGMDRNHLGLRLHGDSGDGN